MRDYPIKVNVGRVVLNDNYLKTCDEVKLKYSNFGGRLILDITINCYIATVDEPTIKCLIGRNRQSEVILVSGYKCGGIEPIRFVECTVDSIETISKQGELVKTKILISKEIKNETNN